MTAEIDARTAQQTNDLNPCGRHVPGTAPRDTGNADTGSTWEVVRSIGGR